MIRSVRLGATAAAVCAALWVLINPVSLAAARGDGRLHVTFLDVGQGDSILVVFPRGRSLLVDAGGLPSSSSFDIGDRVVAGAGRRGRPPSARHRRDDAIADVEGRGGRQPAGIDEQRTASRKDDENRVALADVQKRDVQPAVATRGGQQPGIDQHPERRAHRSGGRDRAEPRESFPLRRCR